MYLTCDHGHRHWGAAGAAGALLVAPRSRPTASPRVLLTLRSPQVHQGDTWSVPGGAIDPGEDVHQAAAREVFEELGLAVHDLPELGRHAFECGGWAYTTVLLAAPEPYALSAEGWETDDVQWFEIHQVDELTRLHPSFARSWPALKDLITASAGEPRRPLCRSELADRSP